MSRSARHDGKTKGIAAVLAAGLLLTPLSSALSAEKVVDLPTVRGAIQRVLIDVPVNPRGSVVLLTGGDGNLALDADGRIGSMANNQLVRTRALYVAAGFAFAVPDLAADLKNTRNYRADSGHGRDIAKVIAHMRAIKGPVVLIATSRGALSAATVMLKQSDALPDALVITSGSLLGQASAESMGDPARIRAPVLLVGHQNDTCHVSLPADMTRYATRLTGSARVDTRLMTGGWPARSDVCDAQSPHGFFGLDKAVVRVVTEWIASLK